MTSLEGQLSSARTSDLFMHVYSRASFHRSSVNSFRARFVLVLHEQTHIAVTRLVCTAVILDSSETRRPLSNGRTLKMYSCKIFWRSKAGFERTPRTPPLLTGLHNTKFSLTSSKIGNRMHMHKMLNLLLSHCIL